MAARRIRKLCSRASSSLIGLHGVVGDLVVVALVADGRGKLGIVLEAVFPVVVEEIVERLAAVFKRGGRLAGGRGGGKLGADRGGGRRGFRARKVGAIERSKKAGTATIRKAAGLIRGNSPF